MSFTRWLLPGGVVAAIFIFLFGAFQDRTAPAGGRQAAESEQTEAGKSEPEQAPTGRPETAGTPNRLIHQKSPYLLQHAYNPVDWYPWGSEAFEKAAAENKPIFLSIGYSTCHWCHVMERESFSDEKIAALMNEHLVSIKVDREERPDVDHVYMTYVQAATGGGGWPMSVFLTPDRKPFFGGTYYPPDRFTALVQKVAEEWNKNRAAIVASAGKIAEALKDIGDSSRQSQMKVEGELLDRTFQWYESAYDAKNGGFGGAPKFPRPVSFNFLFRYYARAKNEKALAMVAHTLRKMSKGGIHDHVGGGFHRYSTDGRWFLPHFEKMLYDQAQLVVSFLEAYQTTGDPMFAETARDILDYVLRDMTGEEGGFFSAEDADSQVSFEDPHEEAEGAFYVWSRSQIAEVLGEDAEIFSSFYGVEKNGNVQRDPFGEFGDKNVLHITTTGEEAARRFGKSEDKIQILLERSRQKLLKKRSERPRPARDDKILTAWNGLMISAFSRAYQVLQVPRYLQAAEKSASFIVTKMYDRRRGILKRRFRDAHVAIDGFLDDYAFFTQGLLDLYETSLDGRWLTLAMDLTETQNRLFWDEKNGGFFNTSGKDPSILIRAKEDYDGAEPAPNSVAVLNLLRLSQMADKAEWRQMAEKSIQAFHTRLTQSPHGMPQMMVAVAFHLQKPKQIFIAGDRASADTRAILREIHSRFIPGKIVVLADGGEAHRKLAATLDVLDSLRRIDDRATAYICEDYVCSLPTTDVETVGRLLDGSLTADLDPQPPIRNP